MFINAFLILASVYLANHWIGGLCTAVLLLIWRLLPRTEGLPVLAMAMTSQWLAVSIGVYYHGVFPDRALDAIDKSNWEPMVLVGLGCVTVLTIGLNLGLRYVARRMPPVEGPTYELATLKTLAIAYIASIVITGVMQELAWNYPTITQAIFALTRMRIVLIYLLLRRLLHPTLRWNLAVLLLGTEVALGFTGFFSSFKEPLLMGGLAMLEVFNPRRREHWAFGGAVAVVLAAASIMWMGVRGEYREALEDELVDASRTERLERVQALSTDWFTRGEGTILGTLDTLIDRTWVVYYPALALSRVPTIIPHTEGELLSTAVWHIVTPRIIFPDKPDLINESELVRKYSGIWVAGDEVGTSIAFGYAAESYVDFGMPLMFLPVFVLGLAMGAVYSWLLRLIHNRELAISLVTCVFWLNLYLFERSWARMLGLTLTMLAYLGGTVFLLDRWMLMRAQERAEDDAAPRAPAFGTYRH